MQLTVATVRDSDRILYHRRNVPTITYLTPTGRKNKTNLQKYS